MTPEERKEAKKASSKKYYQANKESNKESKKTYQKAYDKKYYEANKDKIKTSNKKYYKTNKEKLKVYSKEYQTANKAKCNAKLAKYNATKLKATPSWFEKDKILDLYSISHMLTEITGTQYHVDHIIPLQSKVVCGLHCRDNLQILTAHDNCSKSNKYEIT